MGDSDVVAVCVAGDADDVEIVEIVESVAADYVGGVSDCFEVDANFVESENVIPL